MRIRTLTLPSLNSLWQDSLRRWIWLIADSYIITSSSDWEDGDIKKVTVTDICVLTAFWTPRWLTYPLRGKSVSNRRKSASNGSFGCWVAPDGWRRSEALGLCSDVCVCFLSARRGFCLLTPCVQTQCLHTPWEGSANRRLCLSLYSRFKVDEKGSATNGSSVSKLPTRLGLGGRPCRV